MYHIVIIKAIQYTLHAVCYKFKYKVETVNHFVTSLSDSATARITARTEYSQIRNNLQMKLSVNDIIPSLHTDPCFFLLCHGFYYSSWCSFNMNHRSQFKEFITLMIPYIYFCLRIGGINHQPYLVLCRSQNSDLTATVCRYISRCILPMYPIFLVRRLVIDSEHVTWCGVSRVWRGLPLVGEMSRDPQLASDWLSRPR